MKSSDRRSILAIVILATTACAQEPIAHQQIERDANKILVLLRKEGIDAKKARDVDSRDLVFNVFVTDTESTQALQILEEHNLPENRKPDTVTMFQESGLIPTTQQERAKREVGVQGDVINELRKVPRVIDVSATVSIPEDNPLRDVNEARPRPKAAVIIQYIADANNNPPMTVEEVQRFVQARLPEMRPNEVSVLLISNKTNGASPDKAGDPMTASGQPMIDPGRACVKRNVLWIDVCEGAGKRLLNVIIGSVITAGLLAAMAIFAVLRAMRYRKDLTRLTAQFERVKGSR